MVLNAVRERVRTKEVDEDEVEELSDEDGGVTVAKIVIGTPLAVTVTCFEENVKMLRRTTTNSTQFESERKGRSRKWRVPYDFSRV